MERKANIPVTILVIGIFVVCTIALLSFIISKNNAKDSFIGVGSMEKMNSQIEDYSVHGDLARVDTKINDQGERVFYQEQKKTFGILLWKEQRVVFSVEYKLPLT